MKCAILFAFAAFAFLAQAESKTVIFGLPNGLDRGAIAEYLKQKLAAAKDKLDEMLSKAQAALKEKIEQVKNKAEHLIEQLKLEADKISDKVFEAAHKILDKLESSIAEVMPRSHNIEGISECMIMKDNFRMAVMSVIANASSCINDKIEEAESYITEIYSRSSGAFKTINQLKTQGLQCIKDIDSIKQIISASACVAKATAKGTIVVGTTVPAVMLNIAKLAKELATLQVDLAICMPTNALLTLVQQAEPVIAGVKDCIKEKIEESKAPKENSEEESDNEVL